jgi:large subunit ribosomal protein L4
MRGGGVIFGPHPRSYEQKIPKKVRRLALKMALTSKAQNQNLLVVDHMAFDQAKTKEFVTVVNKLKTPNALIVTVGDDKNLELSARNVPGIKVMRLEGLNVYDILKFDKLVLLEGAIKGLEGRLLS